MRALRNESLALIHNSTGMGQLAVIAAQLERIELRPKLRTNSVAVLTNFVKSGIGVAFMPELTVSHRSRPGISVACRWPTRRCATPARGSSATRAAS